MPCIWPCFSADILTTDSHPCLPIIPVSHNLVLEQQQPQRLQPNCPTHWNAGIYGSSSVFVGARRFPAHFRRRSVQRRRSRGSSRLHRSHLGRGSRILTRPLLGAFLSVFFSPLPHVFPSLNHALAFVIIFLSFYTKFVAFCSFFSSF